MGRFATHEPKHEEAIILTYTGRYVNLLRPRPEDICIDDIAAALSKLNRFTGHTPRVYTVAEHCLTPLDLVTQENRLEYLMHDASEAYLGDVSGPMKRLLGMEFYRNLETVWTYEIGLRFGLCGKLPKEVHEVDQRMLVTEQRDLSGRQPVSTDKYQPFSMRLSPVAPAQEMLQRDFISMFYALAAKTEGAIR